jgi:chorismate synthase
MAGNSFGERFRITTFGESHGPALGVVIDGCPAGFDLDLNAIQLALDRRRPGQSRISTQRKEGDRIEILSGVQAETGLTLGTPIAMIVRNEDAKSNHYSDIAEVYRPSHADYTYDARYGLRAVAGGGRSSARETVGRVAAGALAQGILRRLHGIEIVAWVDSVGAIVAGPVDPQTLSVADVDQNDIRCPNPVAAQAMITAIEEARKQGDSLGGVVRCVARQVPAGLGEPVFGKITADLGGAMMSLPASRGFSVGEGFAAATWRGSEHNDPFYADERGVIRTRTNHSGGIQGGITNGESILFSVAFKPVATIFIDQESVNAKGESVTFSPRKGRHDPCVVARAVPMVEAMAALVICDHVLRRQGVRMEEML